MSCVLHSNASNRSESHDRLLFQLSSAELFADKCPAIPLKEARGRVRISPYLSSPQAKYICRYLRLHTSLTTLNLTNHKSIQPTTKKLQHPSVALHRSQPFTPICRETGTLKLRTQYVCSYHTISILSCVPPPQAPPLLAPRGGGAWAKGTMKCFPAVSLFLAFSPVSLFPANS